VRVAFLLLECVDQRSSCLRSIAILGLLAATGFLLRTVTRDTGTLAAGACPFPPRLPLRPSDLTQYCTKLVIVLIVKSDCDDSHSGACRGKR